MRNLLRRSNKAKDGVAKIFEYNLITPPHHALSDYQKKHKLYDQFLPVLVKHIPEGRILDIGANIGDTTIAIVQKCSNKILCIEPSDYFSSYLEKNISSLPAELRNRLEILECFIGTGSYSGELVHIDKGTAKSKLESDRSVDFTSLNEILSKESEVALIKVDVDGFDFDVLNSGLDELPRLKPILFWENQIDYDFQLKEFDKLYSCLTGIGYDHIYVFDNFGNYMTFGSNFQVASDLNKYIFSQLKHDCTRTVYYTDILAATSAHGALLDKVVDIYRSEFIMI